MENNLILEKSKAFALRIIKLYQYLNNEKKENETEYWLELLHESGYIETAAFDSIYSDCKELIKILASITKTAKGGTN